MYWRLLVAFCALLCYVAVVFQFHEADAIRFLAAGGGLSLIALLPIPPLPARAP